MARPLRLKFSGVIYHITSRGNARCAIGSAKFVEGMKPLLEGREVLQEVHRGQRFAHRPELETALSFKRQGDKEERNRVIRDAHFKYGYTLKEIGRHLGLHYTTISKIINFKE